MPFSHSTIDRLEQGRVAGRQDIVRHLDQLYGADEYFVDVYGRLMHPRWHSRQEKPIALDDRYARSSWQHTYPASHQGDVWVLVRATRDGHAQAHHVVLNWGPWQQQLDFQRITEPGLVLVTGKSKDIVAVPLRVTVIPPAHLLFGTDDESSVDLSDARLIHRGWREVEHLDPVRTAGALLAALRVAAERPDTALAERALHETAASALAALGPQRLATLLAALRDSGDPPPAT